MNEKCLHIYVDEDDRGERVGCLNCSRIWSPDPEPEWPKVFEENQSLNLLSDLSEARRTIDVLIRYQANQDGTFEIISVNGRKLEDE